MATTDFIEQRPKLWPWLAVVIVLAIAIMALRYEGRLWICSCGRVDLWAGNTQSADNSQHLFDPYSFTHVQHGLLFYAALVWALPHLPLLWRLFIAVAGEALWEIVENSPVVIQRYREATLALGYEGDTIVNVVGDIACMIVGFWLARTLGFRRSAALFVATEVVLVLWIRDSLLLNIIMLLLPIDMLRSWQLGG